MDYKNESIKKEFFGKTSNGENIYSYKIKNSNGEYVKILNYGAIIQSLFIKDKNNNIVDVVLGYDTIEDYEKADKYMGAVIGRFANRIAKGKFYLNNKSYSLYTNNGENHLHGGKEGFDKKLFDVCINNDDNSITLTYISKDKEEGYDGNLKLDVKYKFDTLDNATKLVIEYNAISDEDTPINITNHSYFNICGNDLKDILDTKLKLYCDYYTPNDKNSIPTGEILKVDNTPMDFRKFKSIGKDIDSDFDQIVYGNGYDINFVVNSLNNDIVIFAEAFNETSGIVMKAYTNQKGVQFYTGNYLDNSIKCKNNTSIDKRYGFCLETQAFPDSVNKNHFPSCILRKNHKYNTTTIYEFNTI